MTLAYTSELFNASKAGDDLQEAGDVYTLADDLPACERGADYATVAAFCRAAGLPGKRVGNWIWLEFAAKPADDVRRLIKDAGFYWNKRRSFESGGSIWQHRCDCRRSRFNKRGDPRAFYGESDV